MNKLKIACMSDIHLGHRRTQTSHTLKGISYLLFQEKNRELDYIFIAGDVFDKMLQYADEDVLLIQSWIVKFLRFCQEFNIGVRIVEGTPYHDRKQSKHFVNINNDLKEPIDLQYVDELIILPLGNKHPEMTVLYVPDEWDKNTSITKDKVKDLLLEKKLTQVDFIIMHGMFPFQLPNIPHLNFHDTEFYLDITKHFISIGDIHTPSTYEKIIAQGSPTRLGIGEEEPKGMFRLEVDIDNPKLNKAEFIENIYAKRYDKIKVNQFSEDGLKKKLYKLIEELEDDSYITLEGDETLKHFSLYEYFKNTYPLLNWNYNRKIKKVKVSKQDKKPKREIVSINPNNVKGMIEERIKGKLDSDTEQYLFNLLESYNHG